MVSASLRQNGGRAPEQNPFTPGKTPKEWTETRTREAGHDQWPHPQNPGLIADSLGYYDWAGRRLFLSDGFPDPETPGAYRYQTRPDLCDPHATDDDPASPRYEPMHLRHKPGDEWMIGGRAYDPDDPGPFGSPGWRPDRRTGRHRRGERPDPVPPWEWQPGDPESPDFARTRIKWDAYGNWTPERIAKSGRPEDGAGQVPDRGGSDRTGGDTDPDADSERDSDDLPGPGSDGDSGWNSGSGTGIGFRWTTRSTGKEGPSAGSRPSPGPAAEGRGFWATTSGNTGSAAEARKAAPASAADACKAVPSSAAEARRAAPGSADAAPTDFGGAASASEPAAPQGFTRMQEEAFHCFMEYSAELAAAHLAPAVPYFRERIVWTLHWLVWIAALGFIPAPRPLTAAAAWAAKAAGVGAGAGRVAGAGIGGSAGGACVDSAYGAGGVDAPHHREAPTRIGRLTPSSSGASSPPAATGSVPRHGSEPAAIGSGGSSPGCSTRRGFAAARFAAGAAAGRAAAGARRLAHDTRRPSTTVAADPHSTRAVAPSSSHWRARPGQARPAPSRIAYMAQWEQAFDSQAVFGGVAL